MLWLIMALVGGATALAIWAYGRWIRTLVARSSPSLQ
jgi:hypothetical protein